MKPVTAPTASAARPTEPPLLNLLLQSAGTHDSEVVVEDLRSGRRHHYGSLRALAQAWLDDPPQAGLACPPG